MTDHHEAAVTTKDDTPRTKQTPGEMLRTARENSGLTLQSVSEALHLTAHYVRCLESDDYAKLPGLTFAKGYLRAYARHLRMDVDVVLANYESYLVSKGLRQHVHDFSATSLSNIGGRGRSDQSFAWALMAGVVLVIALAAAWWFVGRDMELGLARGIAPTAQTSTITTPAATQASTNIAAPPTRNFTVPAAPQGFQQNVSQNFASVAAPGIDDGAAASSVMQAANAGVAVINATLEARQEEAQLAGTAPAATDAAPGSGAAAAGDAISALRAPGVGGMALQQTPVADSADVASATPTTVLGNSGREVITAAGGARVITLRGTGNDRLEIRLDGNSWAEIHDAQGAKVFSDMLRGGDKLSVEGAAPFTVLLGDARQAQASFNAQAVDLSTLIRADNTARFRLGAEGISAIIRGTEQAAAVATE
jgi:cytoskeleton protein RodZ